MAIQFARIKIVGRKDGGNACRTSTYNARSKVVDEKTGEVFDFTKKGDNVYHNIFLPEGANKKFEDISVLSNEVEEKEKKSNSQLLKEIVVALPDDKEFSLEDRINITHLIIEEMGWVKNGLAVQMDIHKPHDDKKNWHAHLLVTTRRFTEDGNHLGKKARDLNPEFKTGKGKGFIIPEEDIIHEKGKRIINDYAKKMGYETRVDFIGLNPQEHVGPVRMRKVMNEAVERNEERRASEIEHLSDGVAVLNKITNHMSVFTKGDLTRAVKCIPSSEVRTSLVEEALSSKSIIFLYTEDGKKTQYFSTKEVRLEEEKIMRLSGYVANGKNVLNNQSSSSLKQTKILLGKAKKSLTEEQHKALSEIILSKSGLSILRGRAGSGKSYVLKEIASIGSKSGVNVIGVAPTHKAKLELQSDGFNNTDTIKGMLFKLANGRFDLPKNSLIVVDEAGMVGNDDFKELFRVAATRGCSMILSGDERQLASVQRGGMYEIALDRYGSSSILDIQRQKSQWGKSVAMALSNGDVETGVEILEKENRVKWSINSNESMEGLLLDWSKSKYDVNDRLILAVNNRDVAALNHGARQYLKSEGYLGGEEISVAGNHYMKGDRILITRTNKDLGVVNGDIAFITNLSKDEFQVKILSDKISGNSNYNNDSKDVKDGNDEDRKKISFNPSEYYGFRHGYATTIFKAQGASINDVYVFHNGFAGIRNSYVALSRNKLELNLYANKESTFNKELLIKQLARDAEAGSSLSYLTEKDLKEIELSKNVENNNNSLVKGFNKLLSSAVNAATKVADKYIPSSEYYNYQAPKDKVEVVSGVIDKIYEDNEKINQDSYIESYNEEKLVVGGDIASTANNIIPTHNINVTKNGNDSNSNSSLNNTNNVVKGSAEENIANQKTKQSAKTRFYAKADFVKNDLIYQKQKEGWDREYEQLKSELKFKSEIVARDLLGDPNKRLSNGRELRYGDSGKIVVRISGEKAGTWYDFSKCEGGDLFALYKDQRGGDFKEASEYLRGVVGMSSSRLSLQLVNEHINSDRIVESIKNIELEKQLLQKKQDHVNKLYSRSRYIGKESVAHKYLSKIRSIDVDISNDMRTAGIYSQEQKKYVPSLVAFARDKDDNITGGQHISLDKKTGGKASISIPKRSFGSIGGSFVNLGVLESANKDNCDIGVNINNIKEKITIIAEGLETGLSIKQALGKELENNHQNIAIKTLCSLGVSNIKNYEPSKWEQIIIAADNDGKESVTSKTLENAKLALEEKGAFVEIVKPKEEGDYNDVLKSKGEKVIAQDFKKAISKHTAIKIELPDKELDKELKSMSFDLAELSKLGIKTNKDDLLNKVKNLSHIERSSYGNKLLAYHASKYFSSALSEHIEEKDSAKNYNEFMQAISKEQKTLLGLYEDHKFAAQAIDEHCQGKHKILNLTRSAYEVNKIGGMPKVMKSFDYAINHKITNQENIKSDLQGNGGDLERVHSIIDKKCNSHQNDMLKTQRESSKTLDQNKQKEIKIDKSFTM